jgi:cell division protein FtsB
VNFNPSTDNLDESQQTWRLSLAFWVCLLLAAVVYASVALAPKLRGYVTLNDAYRKNRTELVALEQRVSHLERVRDALENDPEFAAELARIDFNASRPGDERIAVEPLLSLEAVPTTMRPSPVVIDGHHSWYAPLLEVLAGNRTIRMSFLAIAAVVTLGAFTFLHETDEMHGVRSPAGITGPFRRFINRYRKVDARETSH